jgi:hypothetical protein
MRVSAPFSSLLCLPGVWVRSVRFEPDRVVVTVALRRRRLHCPKCSHSTRHRESKQHHESAWRRLDLGRWRLEVHARWRGLVCPAHGALVEGVPFARDGARFARDFENLVVRHEAPLNRVGCRSPPPDLSQQFGEAGQPDPGDAGSGGSSPVKAGTGRYCQMAWVRRARQRGVTQVNQWLNPREPRTGSKPGGFGPASSARPR